MATNPSGKKRSHRQILSHHQEEKRRPHFFKIVSSPVNRCIKIPTAFMRQYGESLEKVVFFKVPTGASRSVELLQSEAGTWLYEGWRQFAEYYSIGDSYLLVFRYDGNSQFHVIIFDTSASEIEYRPEATQGHGIVNGSEVESDDDSIEILEEIPDAASYSLEQGRKSTQIDEQNPPQIIITKGSSEGTPNTQFSNAKIKTVIGKDKFMSYQRAKAFTSKNPFFICFMQPSYVTNTCTLCFSLSFAMEYLTKDKHCNLDLRVLEGENIWPVICTLSTRDAKIRRGWKKFVQDNNLEVGDVCAFELVRGTQTFKITIYRSYFEIHNYY